MYYRIIKAGRIILKMFIKKMVGWLESAVDEKLQILLQKRFLF